MPKSSKPVSAPDLYCITDVRLSGMAHEEQVAQMLEGGARIIQLRDKNLPDHEFELVANKCRSISHWSEALFIVNDRVRSAAAVKADGVHLGQGDMSPAQAREILGEEVVVGLSTHNRAQFTRALEEPVDYIALGPVFPTTTKENPDPVVGLEFVTEASEMLRDDHRPLVLIGGINQENLPALLEAAPRALVAIMGGLLARKDLAHGVREYRRIIRCRE